MFYSMLLPVEIALQNNRRLAFLSVLFYISIFSLTRMIVGITHDNENVSIR